METKLLIIGKGDNIITMILDNLYSNNNTPEAKTTTESMNSMSRKRNRLDENAASVNDTYSDLNNILGNNSSTNEAQFIGVI